MATVYDSIEDAIVTALKAVNTPLVTVEARGAGLSDADLIEELMRLADGTQSPAALVLYAGGDSNEGYTHVLTEDALYDVVVISATRTRTAATRGSAQDTGIYELLTWCRGQLHDLRNSGVLNDLIYMGTRRLAIAGSPLTVAAYAMRYKTMIQFA
jgi:hypothetical protein